MQKATAYQLVTVMKVMATTSKFEDLYLVFDALNECLKGHERDELSNLITEMRSWTDSNCHIIITSREEPDIKQILTPLLTTPAISIQGSEVASDIDVYIDSQLTGRLAKFSDDIKSELKHTLSGGAHGMLAPLRLKLDVEICSHATRFRWVFC